VSGTWIALIVALAAVALAAGFLLGHSPKKSETAEFTNSATVGHLQLRYPSSWELRPQLPAVPGMVFKEPIMLGPIAAAAGLTAGEVSAAGPTLLPASFRRQVEGGVPAGEPVQLGDLQAYRYADLHVRGLSGTVTVYAVPTTAGVATITCWTESKVTRPFQTECGQVASTLQLHGISPYPIGAGASDAALLSATFSRLRTDSGGPLARVRAAGSASGQAQAEQQLATAYAQAATQLGGATVSPLVADVRSSLVGALRRVAEGYSHAAAAARSGDTGAYHSAGLEIGAGSAELTSALRALRSLGYTVET
jgi:hypothetical protein